MVVETGRQRVSEREDGSMATAAEQLHDSTAPLSAQPVTTDATQVAALVQLFTSIWQIPYVVRLGLVMDAHRTDVWVIVDHDDPDAESFISEAEYAYLQRTHYHPFELYVVPRSDVQMDMLPSFETILER